jgi:hypothetical protein
LGELLGEALVRLAFAVERIIGIHLRGNRTLHRKYCTECLAAATTPHHTDSTAINVHPEKTAAARMSC